MSEHPADNTTPMDDPKDIERIFELSEDQPVFITKDGRVSRVLMSIDLYDRIEDILSGLELRERCRRAKTEGNSVDAVELIQELLERIRRGESIRILDPEQYAEYLFDLELERRYLESETNGGNVNAKEFLEKLMNER